MSKVSLEDQWTIFGIFPRSSVTPGAELPANLPSGSCIRHGADPELNPTPEELTSIPESLTVAGVTSKPVTAGADGLRLDIGAVLGKLNTGDWAYIYIPVEADEARETTFGFGADWWMQVWLNGQIILDTTATGNVNNHIETDNHVVNAYTRDGTNLIVVRLISGTASSILAVGGPAQIAQLDRLRAERYPQPPAAVLPGGAGSIDEVADACRVSIEKYDVFCDMRSRGVPMLQLTFMRESDGLTPVREADGSLSGYFCRNLNLDYCADHAVGTHSFVTKSSDDGTTWSDPIRVDDYGLVKNERLESLWFCPLLRTQAGTQLYVAVHQVMEAQPTGSAVEEYVADLATLEIEKLVGRCEKGQPECVIETLPEFMQILFMEYGLQLPSGRLVFTAWGGNHHENWRCGCLLSDDDGKTWRFSQVGYEPAVAIRDVPTMPAGFSEQTLFPDADGRLVSIIRGQEDLGRGVPGRPWGCDTWFFRSESLDDGETWSKPEITNLPGTGGTCGKGLVLPDGSYIIGVRLPYSRDYYDLPQKNLFGLNLARSFDQGRTWTPQFIVQHDPEGIPMNTHHSVMNGMFLSNNDGSYDYVFGFFEPNDSGIQRILRLRLGIK